MLIRNAHILQLLWNQLLKSTILLRDPFIQKPFDDESRCERQAGILLCQSLRKYSTIKLSCICCLNLNRLSVECRFAKVCRPVAGTMTLTKSPCDLDTMSLFQDLKLKRRKVDSRCSSDGKWQQDQLLVTPPGGCDWGLYGQLGANCRATW